MTTEIDQLRLESRLTEQFRIHTYEDGSRIVAANGYVVDYAMFSAMLIWMLGGSVCYISVMSKNDAMMDRVKKLNPDVNAIQQLSGYSLVKHVFNRIGRMLKNNSKQELIDIMSAHIELNKLST